MTNVIALGRAYVGLIEAVQVIVGYTDVDDERERIEQLMSAYQAGLQDLPDKMSSEVSTPVEKVRRSTG